ncbi:MAG: hypothetical protein ABL883_10690 [Terricaulis sp.]
MSEGEVVQELVEFTNIVLVGVSLIFSVVSAYIVALNYFIGSANFIARLGSFGFITLVLGMLMAVMAGAQTTQEGLIARLREIEGEGALTAAGRAVLANARADLGVSMQYSLDDIIQFCIWIGFGFVYIALAYLTFFHRWTPDAIPVTIQQRAQR